jgi:HD-GYP domain-containing protein (c-di-GMP phosphodiesterase class II)
LDLLKEILVLKDSEGRYIIGHQVNVYFYAGSLARLIASDLIRVVEVAALFHDIGKIGIPDEILCKMGKPTPGEWEVIRRHPVLGAELFEKCIKQRSGSSDLVPEEARAVCAAILCHHERWDDNGYPNGLKGEEIPLTARIIAVADAYDAMTADRPYRKAMGGEEAFQRIAEGAGRQFDLEVAARFLEMVGNQKRMLSGPEKITDRRSCEESLLREIENVY